MDLHEIRKRNLRYLADTVFGREKLAQALGYPDVNYINGVVSGHTKLGTSNAKRFGIVLGLGDNWFNEPHEPEWTGVRPSNAEQLSTLDKAIDGLCGEDLELLLALAKRLSLLKVNNQKENK